MNDIMHYTAFIIYEYDKKSYRLNRGNFKVHRAIYL